MSIVEILDKIYKRIGIQQHSPTELVEICEKNPKIYDIYSSGQVFEVNQMGSPRTIAYLKEFKPKNVYDLSTVVADIRPGAMKIVDRMMNRKEYTYDIEEIDELLSNHTGSAPAIQYQESIIMLISMAGISMPEAFTILKAISKKNIDVIMEVEVPFKDGLSKRFNVTTENHAIVDLWNQIVDSAAYAFNAPHSLSTALDSLYMAYLKTVYPEDTYAVLLEYYLLGKKRNIPKVSECKKELENIGYSLEPISYGQDNRQFSLNGTSFVQSLMSMKGSNSAMAEIMYNLSKKTLAPIEIYERMKSYKNIDTNRAFLTKVHWKILCKSNYFPDQNNKKLETAIPDLFDRVYSKKQFTLTALAKLEKDFGVKLSDTIEDFCTRKTAKTYYLDPDKKNRLVQFIFDKMQIADYTAKESAVNGINVFGFLSDPEQYFKHNMFTGVIKMVSRKNSSILIKTLSGKESWVAVTGDMSEFKKKETIFIMEADVISRFGKKTICVKDYVTYK